MPFLSGSSLFCHKGFDVEVLPVEVDALGLDNGVDLVRYPLSRFRIGEIVEAPRTHPLTLIDDVSLIVFGVDNEIVVLFVYFGVGPNVFRLEPDNDAFAALGKGVIVDCFEAAREFYLINVPSTGNPAQSLPH